MASVPAELPFAPTNGFVPGPLRRGSNVMAWAQGAILPSLLLLLWEGTVRAGWIAPNLLPPPTALVATLKDLAANGEIFRHIAVSSLRVLIGFSIGAAAAVVVGGITIVYIIMNSLKTSAGTIGDGISTAAGKTTTQNVPN